MNPTQMKISPLQKWRFVVYSVDEIDPTEEHKVLGSNWNLAEDTFVLKLSKVVEFARDLEPTRHHSQTIWSARINFAGYGSG